LQVHFNSVHENDGFSDAEVSAFADGPATKNDLAGPAGGPFDPL
jgi:hypothetical protein